jgi:ribosomal protein L29
MKIKEIRKMTNEELNVKIVYFKKELFDTKLQLELSKTKNTSLLRKTRIIIAQIKTVLNERKLYQNVMVVDKKPKKDSKENLNIKN